MKIGLAFRAFWASLFSPPAAAALEKALAQAIDGQSDEPAPKGLPQPSGATSPARGPAAIGLATGPAPGRSDALTLLAALQREARLIDLVQEPLDSYSDAQVGAAARQVLKDSQKVLHRFFDIEPIAPSPEGSKVQLPADAVDGQYRFADGTAIGPAGRADSPTVTIVHPGWRAKQVQIPLWTGRAADAMVLSPAEVQRG